MNGQTTSPDSQNKALGLFQTQFKNILSSLGVTWSSTISKKKRRVVACVNRTRAIGLLP
jgi:hypothetical protein